MSSEPICEYESEEQLVKSLKEWQERLFLNDWIICIELSESENMQEDERGKKLGGHVDFLSEQKSAYITISRYDGIERVIKHCEELILVHELLHCKYNLVSTDDYAGEYLDMIQHQKIEEMAKSLIMAKYNIPLSWFKNF